MLEQVYVGGVMYFGANCAAASIAAFLPTIILTFGFSMYLRALNDLSDMTDPHKIIANARAQLLTVPPYAVSVVVLCLTSYTSDRLQSRGLFVSMAAVLDAIGYLLLSKDRIQTIEDSLLTDTVSVSAAETAQ